jgi:hypothetical protein
MIAVLVGQAGFSRNVWLFSWVNEVATRREIIFYSLKSWFLYLKSWIKISLEIIL